MHSKELAILIGQFISERKATDIVILNISKLTFLADYFVIATVTSERHIQALISELKDELHKQKISPLGLEGAEMGRWGVADYDDVVLHLYLEEARKFYDLEELWGDATRLELTNLELTNK